MFKRWLYKKIFEFLTKPVTVEQVITINDRGQVFLDGRLITNQELSALKEETKAFNQFRLKTILLNTPKALAEMRMFKDSQSFDDMLAGKLMLYNVDVMEQVIAKILAAPFNVEQK